MADENSDTKHNKIKKYLIYKHTSPSGKIYIGQTSNYKKRCSQHKSQTNRCQAFSKAIEKYGWENFTHEILKENLTIDEANHWEEFYICDLNTLSPNGYNIAFGGNNKTMSEQTRKKLSEALKGRKLPKEVCKKIGDSSRGVKRTGLALEKLLERIEEQRGRPRPKHVIEAMRMGRVGKKQTREARRKISEAAKIYANSEKSKLIYLENHPRKKPISIDGVKFDSIKSASIAINISDYFIKKRILSDEYPHYIYLPKGIKNE
jgi:group I intron endonuclease